MTTEFHQGPASVQPGETQRPQGQATQLNQGLQAVPQAAPLPPVKEATPETGPISTGTEADALFGPTQRPGEHITTGLGRAQVHLPPDYIHTTLPDLQEAANVPGAPPALTNMLQLLVYHMNKG